MTVVSLTIEHIEARLGADRFSQLLALAARLDAPRNDWAPPTGPALLPLNEVPDWVQQRARKQRGRSMKPMWESY